MQVANAFRDAYPDDTERVAAEFIRRGPPAAGTDAEEQAPSDANDATAAAGHATASAADSTVVGGERVEGGQEAAGVENMSPRSEGEEAGRQDGLAQPQAPTPAADDDRRSEPGAAAQENAGEWRLENPLLAENVGEWGQEWVEEETEAPAQDPSPDGEREQAIPVGVGPLSAEDNFRLANAYAQAHPRDINRARAVIYGEENPHFTVQRARIQVSSECL